MPVQMRFQAVIRMDGPAPECLALPGTGALNPGAVKSHLAPAIRVPSVASS